MDLLVCMARVSPLVGSVVESGKVGDKMGPGEDGSVRFSLSLISVHTPAFIPQSHPGT